MTATRDSQEIERQRRLAWEQEQEQKYAQKQADLEKLIIEMRQEISRLRSLGNTELSDPTTQSASSASPISQYSSDMYPSFVQGSSTDLFAGGPTYGNDVQELQSASPGISPPYLACVRPSELYESSPPPVNQKKRATSEVSSEDEEETLSSDDSSSRPVKRVNHHDKRCLTIHASHQNSAVLYSHTFAGGSTEAHITRHGNQR